MNKLVVVAVLSSLLAFTSCDGFGDLIPDVEKVVTETYNVTIDSDLPSSFLDTVLIDVEDLGEYNSLGQYVKGYELTKITYEVLDFNAPEDLYFSASIIAFDTAGTTSVTVGEISSMNLSDVSALDSASVMEQDTEASDQLIDWLDDPGKFNIRTELGYENSEGNGYLFSEEDFGSTFTIKVHFHLSISLGLGSED